MPSSKLGEITAFKIKKMENERNTDREITVCSREIETV